MKHLPLITEKVATHHRSEMIDVTELNRRNLSHECVQFGMAIVYVPHTTAAVTINENADPDVKSDLLHKLEKLIPKEEAYYRHDEGNSDSHLKASPTDREQRDSVDRTRAIVPETLAGDPFLRVRRTAETRFDSETSRFFLGRGQTRNTLARAPITGKINRELS